MSDREVTNESERLTGGSTHVQRMEHLHTQSIDSWVIHPLRDRVSPGLLYLRGMAEYHPPTTENKLASILDYRLRCLPWRFLEEEEG